MHEKDRHSFLFLFPLHPSRIASCSHLHGADLYREIIFAYSLPDRYTARVSSASEKSTWNNPKRTLNPSAHSKLSISDHAKYPRTSTPSSSTAAHGVKAQTGAVILCVQRELMQEAPLLNHSLLR